MNKKTLLGITREVYQLPDYLKDACLEIICKEWLNKSQLMRRVSKGEITLEQIVTPLVEENKKVHFWGHKKGICNSTDFEFMAVSIADELQGIISLEDSFKILKKKTSLKEQIFPTLRNIWLIVFFALVAMPLLENVFPEIVGSIPASPAFLIITGVLLSLVRFDSYRAWLDSKKKKAQKLLESAKFLDEIIKR